MKGRRRSKAELLTDEDSSDEHGGNCCCSRECDESAASFPRRHRGNWRGGGGNSRERLQVESQVVRGVKALLGVLLEAVSDDPIQARMDVPIGC